MDTPPKLLFLVTEDWYFLSHRLPVARAARAAGYRVGVATRVNQGGEAILREGFDLFPIGLQREGFSPVNAFWSLLELWRLYRRVRPDLVHHVALKPVLLGTLAALAAGVPRVLNAMAGLGHLFVPGERGTGWLRRLVLFCFRLLLSPGRVTLLVQNPDDRAFLTASLGLAADKVALIAGAGVDLVRFQPAPEPETPLVLLPARMLATKGVAEFVAAARSLKARGVHARFVLVGEPDPANPASLNETWLRQQADAVEWWGRREEMPAVYAQAWVVALPSYREGMPKTLLEACACGRAVVTTDVPGCREVVTDGDNGLLVPARAVEPLAEALARLLTDHALRQRMGRAARLRAEARFDAQRIGEETVGLYRRMRGG